MNPAAHAQHWRHNLRLTRWLLVAWIVPSFVVTYFARELDFTLWGWPFSFWMAAQGALIIYVLIVGFYARRMRAHDDLLARSEADPETPIDAAAD